MREEIDLFGGPDLVFGCRHLPAEASGAGCWCASAPPSDGQVDDGRAARLGRRLAAAGVAVQRFHYRGAWPSDGDPRGVGFDDLVEDATRALDLLRDRTSVGRVAFVGARLGALVAARVARAEPGAPMALWAPAPDPRAALELAARARVARGAIGPGGRPRLGPAHPPGPERHGRPDAGRRVRRRARARGGARGSEPGRGRRPTHRSTCSTPRWRPSWPRAPPSAAWPTSSGEARDRSCSP